MLSIHASWPSCEQLSLQLRLSMSFILIVIKTGVRKLRWHLIKYSVAVTGVLTIEFISVPWATCVFDHFTLVCVTIHLQVGQSCFVANSFPADFVRWFSCGESLLFVTTPGPNLKVETPHLAASTQPDQSQLALTNFTSGPPRAFH